jgi:allophanate hydrolase
MPAGRHRPAHPPPGRAAARRPPKPTLPLAVVGAHLSGLPLNGQLPSAAPAAARHAHAPAYRLYALPGTTPPKPGLQRVPKAARAIEVEVWAMPRPQVGSFLALVPPPLGLGTLELADGRHVHGFLCEAHALGRRTSPPSAAGAPTSPRSDSPGRPPTSP